MSGKFLLSSFLFTIILATLIAGAFALTEMTFRLDKIEQRAIINSENIVKIVDYVNARNQNLEEKYQEETNN